MIPQFPHFKKLEISDREDIEDFLEEFLPYSSFNFTNISVWDIYKNRQVSILNNNLIFLFFDYETKTPFLSFVGKNKINDTISNLLDFAIKNKMSNKLNFITEESIKLIQVKNNFNIEEDRDNHDYIFSLNDLANLSGAKFKKHRHLYKKIFNNKEIIFKIKDINNKLIQRQIKSVLKKWEKRKEIENKICNLNFEEKALFILLKNSKKYNITLSCLFFKRKMIAFSIDEILQNGYVMSHFIKADNSFKGIYELFNSKLAQYFLSKNLNKWNWQQDLGIANLRKSKMGYCPVGFFKKYKISYKNIL